MGRSLLPGFSGTASLGEGKTFSLSHLGRKPKQVLRCSQFPSSYGSLGWILFSWFETVVANPGGFLGNDTSASYSVHPECPDISGTLGVLEGPIEQNQRISAASTVPTSFGFCTPLLSRVHLHTQTEPARAPGQHRLSGEECGRNTGIFQELV